MNKLRSILITFYHLQKNFKGTGDSTQQESLEKIWRTTIEKMLRFYSDCIRNFNMTNMCEREKFEIVQARKGKKWQRKINGLNEEISQLEMKKVLLQSVGNFDLIDFLPDMLQGRILRTERNQGERERVKPKGKEGILKLQTLGMDETR